MEAMLRRCPVAKGENRDESRAGHGEDADDITLESGSDRRDGQRSNSSSLGRKDLSTSKQDLASSANEKSPLHATRSPSTSSPKDSQHTDQVDHQLESTRAEMGEVKQENERLKTTLARILKDYQSLQMHFSDMVKQGHDRKPVLENPVTHHEADESELVSLSLGTSSGGHKKEEKTAAGTKASKDADEQMKGVLSLGLERNFDRSCSDPSETQTNNASPESSFEETKGEEAGEPCPTTKMLKTMRSEDGDASELGPVKRARVSVRVRCDGPTMNDGCQWRKYGQKIAKGNPCPRAYYRCTVAPSCPVRKQVQRCAQDMSILITTYEGTHNHPLPVSATAMASTTSAAASMLMSGSSSSRDHAATSSIATFHGLNFGLSDISRQRQFYPTNPSFISSATSCPTVTLDLTAPSSSSPPTQFSRLSSSFPSTASYPQTSLTFSSSQHPNTTPTPWSSGYLGYATQPYNTKSQPFYNSFMQQATTHSAPLAGSQGSLTDPAIAAATEAITSDPSFQSALAAAITSIVGGNGGSQAVAEALRQNHKWEEHQVSTFSPFTPSSNGSGCASSYLTRSTPSSSNPQRESLMFLQPSLAFPSSKSTSTSPVETREHIK